MVFGNEASIPLDIMTEINVTEEEPSTNESAYVRKYLNVRNDRTT